MAYPISDVPRRIVYSGSAGVGPYAFTFEVLANTDIAVYKNTTLLTLTTDYTVTINTGTGTGTVTLVVAATGADTVTIVGDRAIQRTSDFVTGGDLFANTLNNELDAQTIYTQQVDEKADRAIRSPVTDPTTISMVLPSQASRAQKLLGFNASGEPTTYVATTTVSDTSLINFTQAGTGAVTRTAQAKMRETVSVKDFGAVGDGVADDTVAIQAALNAAVGVGLTIYMPKGTYKTTATLNWPVDWPVALVGDGVESTSINYTGISTAISIFDAGASTRYVKSSIENLYLTGNGTNSTNGINIRQGYAIALRNIRVRDFEVGVRIEQTWSVVLDFVRIDSCSQVGLELHNEANNIACYCCEFLDNAKGVYTAGARSVLFSECTLEANSQYGAYVTANSTDGQSESIVFHSCYIEANTTNDIRVIADSGPTAPQSVIIRDCYFVGMASKATFAVRVDQADHVVVDGCDFSVGTATYSYSLYISDAGSVDKIRFGKNRDASTNGVYRGTGTTYSDETKLETRAWGRFTVSGGAIASSNVFGVSGITRVSTGIYEVTLREPMPSAEYAVLSSAENGASYNAMLCSPNVPLSTTTFRINTATDASTLADARTVNFSVFA